jgi:hypothetical protein
VGTLFLTIFPGVPGGIILNWELVARWKKFPVELFVMKEVPLGSPENNC